MSPSALPLRRHLSGALTRTRDLVSGDPRPSRSLTALLVLSALALALRLYQLGERVFYYDEAWFGYWVLRFVENGAWEYRPILHGPFFVRINSVVFEVLGASDVTARLVVAAMGGLLPLAAWCYRDHLDDAEVVALGVLLAATPLLVYYSRFMRKDLPLAACMFVGLGFLLRARATRRPRYAYAAAVAVGVAFATKESVLLWLLTWLGAGVLVLDRTLLRTGAGEAPARLGDLTAGFLADLRWWSTHLVGAGAVFLAVVVFFYAPRAGPGQPIGLWAALGGEWGTLPAVVREATLVAAAEAIDYWVMGSIQKHPYLPYLLDTLRTLGAGALAVSLLAPVGFLLDRYAGEGPRALVGFSFYGGVAATLGYPLANNFPVPWSTLHAVVPLSVPAAVGAVAVARWGANRLPAVEPAHSARLGLRVHWERLRPVLAVVLLGGLAVSAGVTVVETAYAHPHESPKEVVGGDESVGSELVYYAQTPGDLREAIRAIQRVSAADPAGADVLYVGANLAMNESRVRFPPATGAWHARMPLPWYTEAAGTDLASVPNATVLPSDPPPVVVTSPGERGRVDARLPDAYLRETYHLDDVGDRTVVVFVHESVAVQDGVGRPPRISAPVRQA